MAQRVMEASIKHVLLGLSLCDSYGRRGELTPSSCRSDHMHGMLWLVPEQAHNTHIHAHAHIYMHIPQI